MRRDTQAPTNGHYEDQQSFGYSNEMMYNARTDNFGPKEKMKRKKNSRRSLLDLDPNQQYTQPQQYQQDTYYDEQEPPEQFPNATVIPPPEQHEPFMYQLGPEIGRGAYGTVYQGLDVKSGAFMAVKKLKFDDTKSTASTEVLNEINLMARLHHENIVRYLGADEKDGNLFIFMEFVPGGSIAHVLKLFKRLHEHVVRKYTQKILQGLQYLHQNNVVHGDIKAANILVNNDGVVKLSDFGHSRVVQQGNSIVDSIRGTPMWMAPEVIKDSRHGKPSDIWSLGCTIIEMMTGDLPWPDFVKLEPFAIMYRIAQTTTGPPIPEDAGQECRDFLAKCFVVDCTKRATVDVLLQHPFITQYVDLKEAPQPKQQPQISPQPVPHTEQVNLTPRRTTSMQNGPPSSIHSELDQMNSRIDKILREQSPTRTMRVQSSPAMGAEMSPISHGRSVKRQSQPLDSYTSYTSQASQYHSYVQQQQSYMQQQHMLRDQQAYLQQQPYPSPRQRYSQPPNDGDMSTEYMYSPQNH